MTPLELLALALFGVVASGITPRITGVFMIVIGLLITVGTLSIETKTGYNETQTVVDANTTISTVTYTYTPLHSGLQFLIGVGAMFSGLALLIIGRW